MKSLEFKKVSVAEARLALEGGPTKPDASESYKRTRTLEEPLLGITRAWLAALPQDVRPIRLAHQFPRIANRLRHLWKHIATCEAYLDDLLVSRRGSRKGFPPEITQELEALREYYARLYPSGRSTWGHVEERK
jgi:hypothetical protein